MIFTPEEMRQTRRDDLIARTTAAVGLVMFFALVVAAVVLHSHSVRAADRQDAADAAARVEHLGRSTAPHLLAQEKFLRARFLVLFELNDAAHPLEDERAKALQISKHDIEDLRAGRRAISAQEMLNICDYSSVSLADFINPDYPLDPHDRIHLAKQHATEWLRDVSPVAGLESATEWLAQHHPHGGHNQ